MTEPIVVATDGSRGATAAVEWAVDDAARRGRTLRIVYVEKPIMYGGQAYERASDDVIRMEGERLLEEAARLATEFRGKVDVSTELLYGDIAEVLRAQSEGAAEIVLGSRGLGGFAGLLLGSVGLRLAGHAVGPVIIVRGAAAMVYGEIVAGVDIVEAAQPVLEYAFEQAKMRGAGLHVIHAWDLPARGFGVGFTLDTEKIAPAVRAYLHSALAPWREMYPDVLVTESTPCANAIVALCEASARADLVVVGSHGRGAIPSAALGSVSHGTLHYAYCPVAVVRPRA